MVSEPQKTGVTLPYEKIAMAGGEMPDGLEYPDQILFLELRMLYDQYNKGFMDRAAAMREKRKLLDVYRAHQFNDQMGKEWTRQIRLTELARAAFRKERTLENADRLLDAIEGTNFGRGNRDGTNQFV
jgi:hypothetical protein